MSKTIPSIQSHLMETRSMSEKHIRSQSNKLGSELAQMDPSRRNFSVYFDRVDSISSTKGPRLFSQQIEQELLEDLAEEEIDNIPSMRIRETIHEYEIRKKLTIFPLFNDHKIAQLSLNYILYFEFYRVAIRLLCYLFFLSSLVYLSSIFTPKGRVYLSYDFPFSQLLWLETESNLPFKESFGMETFMLAIIGVITNFLFMYFWTREKTRILKSELLYDYQWSEDLFSLMIEGLPLDATCEEIKEHFNFFLLDEEIEGSVQDIMLLQDCHEYCGNELKLLKAIRKSKKAMERGDSAHAILKISEELEIRTKLEALAKDLQAFKNFKGKAIIIFDTMRTKEKIENYMSIKWYEIPLKLFGKRFIQRLSFRENKISLKNIVEPKNLYFGNIHYSKVKGLFRIILALLLSLVVFFAGIALISEIESLGEDDEELSARYTIYISRKGASLLR